MRAKNRCAFFPRKETKFSSWRKTALANANCNDSGFVSCCYPLSVTLQLWNKHNMACQAKERPRSGHKWPFCSNEQPNHPHKETTNALLLSWKLLFFWGGGGREALQLLIVLTLLSLPPYLPVSPHITTDTVFILSSWSSHFLIGMKMVFILSYLVKVGNPEMHTSMLLSLVSSSFR